MDIFMKMVRIFTMLLVLIGSARTSYAITYDMIMPLGNDGGRLTGLFVFGDDHIGDPGIDAEFLEDFHIFYYAAGVTDPTYEWSHSMNSISGFQSLPWDDATGDWERIGLEELHPTGAMQIQGVGSPRYDLGLLAGSPSSSWRILNVSDGTIIEDSDNNGPTIYRRVPEPVAAPFEEDDGLIMTTEDNSNFATIEYFNYFKPRSNHSGVDLALSQDGTNTATKITAGKNVYPICDGEVEFVLSRGVDSFIKIFHPDCHGMDVIAYYGHTNPTVGLTTVTTDNPIGIVVQQGWNSHLHLTIDTNLDRDLKQNNCWQCNFDFNDSGQVSSLSNCQFVGYSKSCNEFSKQVDNNKILLHMGWGKVTTVFYKNDNGRLNRDNLYITEDAMRELGFVSFFDLY